MKYPNFSDVFVLLVTLVIILLAAFVGAMLYIFTP